MQTTKIPATIVTGFLGSGKTTLMRHILEQAKGLRIGAYKGDAIAESLQRSGLKPVLVLRDQDNAKKLSTGEIDLWATGDPAGRYLARQIGMTAFKTVLRFNGTQL
ncbi:GTP-binding protein, partial [Comamonas sp.]|uniref:GTP-binding protein n=1 Tax=Comamonas sp. TaxID=34028 RepID=UPI002648F43D